MQARRFCWGPRRTVRCNFHWSDIRHDSVVVVTASEGQEGVDADDHVIAYTSNSPQRFVGSARFTVDNIAPYDGGVVFRVTIDWPSPLTLWTDIILFDELSPRVDGFHRV